MFKLPTFGSVFKKKQASEYRKKVLETKDAPRKKETYKKLSEERAKEERPVTVLAGEVDLAFLALKSPLLTEKSELLKSQNKYVFKIQSNASKGLVKQAVESLYKVKVHDVNILKTAGKKIARRKTVGTKSAIKKAIVTLMEGHTITIGI